MNDRQLSRVLFQLENAMLKLADVANDEVARADGGDAPPREQTQRKLEDARFQLGVIERTVVELREEVTRRLWEEDDGE